MSNQNNGHNAGNGKKTLTPVSKLGEFGLIDHLTKNITLQNASSVKGIGDDAAVIDNKGKLTVVTTDMLVEGIHFDLMYTPMMHLGYKSVVVNLSDIYAMNAQPKQITLAVAISSRFTVEAMEDFYAGVEKACNYYKVDLVGGDTTSSHKGLIICVTAIGQAQATDIVYRNTAKERDYICVSGDLGGAYLGLQILEREKNLYLEDPVIQPELENHSYVIGRQLKPEARNDIADILQSLGIKPTAMIDVSDGLSSDVLHICKQSGVGCRIFEENIPIHPDSVEAAQMFNLSPVTCALNGGEDYELLFTIKPSDIEKLEGLHGISVIGRITPAAEGAKLFTTGGQTHRLVAQGWQHL
ncbi:thiamine-phosphate kinase [Sphingobacteriales bacterium UPWRP_1]|nr:thiamine-phosphate kinase [Sphingobacteriales bacterium TSM_CSS]PSJ72096.1 thiamine-phosphate kinase [Sphingobacteriales bacterium UPWRP_1]